MFEVEITHEYDFPTQCQMRDYEFAEHVVMAGLRNERVYRMEELLDIYVAISSCSGTLLDRK